MTSFTDSPTHSAFQVDVNGVKLNTKIDGTGIPLIWSHGLTGSMASDVVSPWIRWEQLNDVVQLVRYDARGHGGSQATLSPGDYVWSALAHDMLGLADRLGIDTFIAGGGSMGCATAIFTALIAPERVRGLVLLTPPTAWEMRVAPAANFGQMADLIENQGVQAYLALLQQWSATEPNWQASVFPESKTFYLDYLRSFAPHVLAALFRGAQLADFPSASAFADVHIPTLILAWTDDPAHPIGIAERIQHYIADADLKVARNADEVTTWTQEIRTFIGEMPKIAGAGHN
jgi:pimeloyl-ACP methyl ester carboxylesterase